MIVVYKYGLAAPHENQKLVFDQLKLASKYRNLLVEIERGRRAAVRMATAEFSQEIAVETKFRDAEGEYERANRALKNSRAGTSSRVTSLELRERLKKARTDKKTAIRALRGARKLLEPQCKGCRGDDEAPKPCFHATPEAVLLHAESERIKKKSGELNRSARKYSGFARKGYYGAWGTYQMIEAAMSASKKAPLYEYDGITPHDPRFVRWDGGGSVAVHIQDGGGASAKEVMSGQHAQLHIRANESAWNAPMRKDRRQAARQAELRIYIGSDKWAAWRMDMHRSLPEKSIIKWAKVHRTMCGPHSKWTVDITCDIPDDVVVDTANASVVAIDVGWRQMETGLRIAGWSDSNGKSGEVRLDAKTIAALDEPSAIRGSRDKRFNRAKLGLAWWLAWSENKPEWLQKETRYLNKWKSPKHMRLLLNAWKENRFSGDAEMLYELELFCARDKYWWGVESRERARSQGRRREQYRIFAANLVREYGVIVIENFDLRKISRLPKIEAEDVNNTARSNRVRAAISIFRGAIINAAQRTGCIVVAVSARDSTRTCPKCGEVENRDPYAITMVCSKCRATWDRDVGGAPVVLLQRWRERPSGAKILVGARNSENDNKNNGKKEGKWQKSKRIKAARIAASARTREAYDKAAE